METPQEKGLLLSYSCLGQCLIHSNHSINICWVELRNEYSEHFKESKVFLPILSFHLWIEMYILKMKKKKKKTLDKWHSFRHGKLRQARVLTLDFDIQHWRINMWLLRVKATQGIFQLDTYDDQSHKSLESDRYPVQH